MIIVTWFYTRQKQKQNSFFSVQTICNADLAKSLWSLGRYDKCAGVASERTGTGQAAMGIYSNRKD